MYLKSALLVSVFLHPCSHMLLVLHPSAQQHVRRAASTEGGIALEGVRFFFYHSQKFEQYISASHTFFFFFFF